VLKYRSSALARSGFIGVMLTILVIAVGLQPTRITELATSIRYQGLFTEAAGLTVGNEVRMSGMKVGTVSDVSLDKGKARVAFTVDSSITLGSETTAHIRTGTLLGRFPTLDQVAQAALFAASSASARYWASFFDSMSAIDTSLI
jgi:phospholipid/cholesterol/gamma-HCH transport system substrate-binding protein